jgi:hypothetical protein
MKLQELLLENRARILKKWFNAVTEVYAPDTEHFLKSHKDPFTNPVRHAIQTHLPSLFDQIIGDMNPERIAACVDPIVRIRAVQTIFSASAAVAFIFDLKTIVHCQIEDELQNETARQQWFKLERNIDQAALVAFDQFSACREKIYSLRVNERKNRFFKAFEKAGLISDPV